MSPTRSSERGFTLAGMIVILTIMAVALAYTIPPMWSKVMARERERQTIFVMKQYAQAIRAYQQKHNAVPTSLDQIKQARNPRLIRGKGEWICPLTGKADWIIIPASAAQNVQQPPGQPPLSIGVYRDPGANPPGVIGQPVAGEPGAVGPIIGVRPNKTGESLMTLKGASNYEQWNYTTVDLENEIAARRNAMVMK